MPTTLLQIVIATLTALGSLTVLIIMVRYLLWPMYKRQPIAMAFAVVLGIALITLLAIYAP
jgi:hypothetical protein